MKTPPKPETPEQWAAYRAILNCDIGQHVISGENDPPEGLRRKDYAIFLLLAAIKELASIHLCKPE